MVSRAKAKLKKAGGKVKGYKVIRFTSALPFAPSNREALPTEADAWVSGSGSICWIRCERDDRPTYPPHPTATLLPGWTSL